MSRFFYFFLQSFSVVMASSALWAAGGAGHGNGVPVGYITTQAINVVMVLALLYFVLRKPLAKHFSERQKSFTKKLEEAERAKVEAENKKKEIRERLARLESSVEESRERALIEANNLKKKIMAEAEVLAQRLQRDAQRTSDYEREKAFHELRMELLNGSMGQAEKLLNEKVEDNDLKRLQTEFVNNIQVANQ
jgi:F-type H+-transporting ATPase subunit b